MMFYELDNSSEITDKVRYFVSDADSKEKR